MKKIVIDFNGLNTLEEFYEFMAVELELDESREINLGVLTQIASSKNYEFEVIKGGCILTEMQEIITDILK